jgi:hypothetical protein
VRQIAEISTIEDYFAQASNLLEADTNVTAARTVRAEEIISGSNFGCDVTVQWTGWARENREYGKVALREVRRRRFETSEICFAGAFHETEVLMSLLERSATWCLFPLHAAAA